MSNLELIRDARGQETAFTYDGHNRVKSIVYPGSTDADPRVEHFTYDDAGGLETRQDRRGIVTTFAYDMPSIVAGRFLQGVGGGGPVPATLALVADLCPVERRGVPCISHPIRRWCAARDTALTDLIARYAYDERTLELLAPFKPDLLLLDGYLLLLTEPIMTGRLVPPLGMAGIGVIAAEIQDLAKRAKERHLKAHEITGSTFTVSNLGMFQIERFTAVINPPEGAILAVGDSREEALERADQAEGMIRFETVDVQALV